MIMAKLAWLSGVECTPGELTGEFLAVVFSPGELALIQEGPAERRAFLDGAISQVMPRYTATLAAMSRNLEALARPDAAEDIVDEIVKVMK